MLVAVLSSAPRASSTGPIFNDYSSVGNSLLLQKEKAIILQLDRQSDFLKNTTAYGNYSRIFVPEGQPLPLKCEPFRANVLLQHFQKMLASNTAVITETGDSWSNCQKLKLPEGCGPVLSAKTSLVTHHTLHHISVRGYTGADCFIFAFDGLWDSSFEPQTALEFVPKHPRKVSESIGDASWKCLRSVVITRPMLSAEPSLVYIFHQNERRFISSFDGLRGLFTNQSIMVFCCCHKSRQGTTKKLVKTAVEFVHKHPPKAFPRRATCLACHSLQHASRGLQRYETRRR